MYPLLILTSDITSPQAPKACSGSRVLASSTRQSFFCQDIKKQRAWWIERDPWAGRREEGSPKPPNRQLERMCKRTMSKCITQASHNNRQLEGLSGYQHNTSQAISVRQDKRKPLKRRHQLMSTIQSKPKRFCQNRNLFIIIWTSTMVTLALTIWKYTKDDTPRQIYFILLLLQHQ